MVFQSGVNSKAALRGSDGRLASRPPTLTPDRRDGGRGDLCPGRGARSPAHRARARRGVRRVHVDPEPGHAAADDRVRARNPLRHAMRCPPHAPNVLVPSTHCTRVMPLSACSQRCLSRWVLGSPPEAVPNPSTPSLASLPSLPSPPPHPRLRSSPRSTRFIGLRPPHSLHSLPPFALLALPIPSAPLVFVGLYALPTRFPLALPTSHSHSAHPPHSHSAHLPTRSAHSHPPRVQPTSPNRSFTFDHVFGEASTQQAVFGDTVGEESLYYSVCGAKYVH